MRPTAVKRDVIHKTGSTQRIATPPEEDRATATGICTKNFVKIGPAVSEICSRRDRQTDSQTDRNTPLPYWGGVIATLLQLHVVTSLYKIDFICFEYFLFPIGIH